MEIRGKAIRAGRTVGAVMAAALVAGTLGGVFAQEPKGPEAPRSAAAEPAEKDGIVRGRVVAVEKGHLKVRDEEGVVRDLTVNETTLVLSDEKDFSIANMPDIQLEIGDLASGDEVEVVLEPAAREVRAGIVTRMSLFEPSTVARGNR